MSRSLEGVSRASRTPSGAPARIAPVGWLAGLAAGMVVLGSAIGLAQLARSNRPHELTAAPYLTLLFAGSVALSVWALLRLGAEWRDREQHPLIWGHGLLAVLLVGLAGVGALLLVVAADTAIKVLQG